MLLAILLGMNCSSSSQITLVHGKLSHAFNYTLIKTIANVFPHIVYVSSHMYDFF
jgi:hypothetical protein